MNKIKFVVFILLMSFCGYAIAQEFNSNANPGDVPSGTTITYSGAENSIDYKNPSGTVEATINTSDHSFDVENVPGFTSTVVSIYHEYTESEDGDGYFTSPGIPVTFEVLVTNEGNVDMTFIMTKSAISYDSASNWDAEFVDGGVPAASVSKALADNSDISFLFRIMPSSLETNSPDSSSGTVTLYGSINESYQTPGTGNDAFFGYNGYYTRAYASESGAHRYGAEVTSEFSEVVLIAAPYMNLDRTSTIDAPSDYTGDTHDAVPGSVITYIIEYWNDGLGDANDVVIIDKVPNDCSGYHVNKTGAQSNVTITADQGDPTEFEVFYSTNPAPSFIYGARANWTLLGTLETGTEEWDLPESATYIKWENANVYSGDGGYLTWGVTIK